MVTTGRSSRVYFGRRISPSFTTYKGLRTICEDCYRARIRGQAVTAAIVGVGVLLLLIFGSQRHESTPAQPAAAVTPAQPATAAAAGGPNRPEASIEGNPSAPEPLHTPANSEPSPISLAPNKPPSLDFGKPLYSVTGGIVCQDEVRLSVAEHARPLPPGCLVMQGGRPVTYLGQHNGNVHVMGRSGTIMWTLPSGIMN